MSNVNVKDKDALLRLNYLQQAAHCILAGNPDNTALVRFLLHTQRGISKRLVLRQDPSVKRTVCKKCSSLLVPGITAKVRQRRRMQQVTVVTCLACGMSKRFLRRPDYCLWVDRAEALLPGQKTDQESAETHVDPAVGEPSSGTLGTIEPSSPSVTQ
ncbi:ribonuclease P protein subunit p21 [Narcine bancroftii]|uniref:ribonuclease P protein subunit p21 n=1 Tax=Narcine bancroftii TaxID=1343680 RepID=UPI003831277F